MSDLDQAKASFFEGLAYLEKRDFASAESLFLETLTNAPNSVPTLNNLAIAQHAQSKFREAELSATKAIEIEPHNGDAYLMLATCLKEQKKYAAAVTTLERLIDIDPTNAEAHCNCAYALLELEQHDAALDHCDRALALDPNDVDATVNRGSVQNKKGCYEAALSDFDKAIRLTPDRANAWLGRANALRGLNKYQLALSAYDHAIGLNGNIPEAWLGRGTVLAEIGQREAALTAYDRALALNPNLPEVWLGRGNLFSELGRHAEAFAAYDRAYQLNPDLNFAEGARLHTKMQLCDWNDLDAEISHLVSGIKGGQSICAPFALLSVSASPDDQLACVKTFVAQQPSLPALWQGKIYRHQRIRVSYVSADLYDHATAYLIAGLFEHHDRSQFEITTISYGPFRPGQISIARQRIQDASEHFMDVQHKTDAEIAQLIHQSEIDIAVDLKGFTLHSRPNLFAYRPAPIQVNYLGYPGTMGADYIDYIIADKTVIPDHYFKHYTEKVVRLPDSYQVNDRRRPFVSNELSRRECGLPETGFVFCCFNNSYKILPNVFDIWMRILRATDNSVLWLLENNPNVVSNLRREAQSRNVDAERLIFAPRMPVALHLARHRLADLFLDTSPYNAHTTASDALWAGLPLLTQIGDTFAARVAASLLKTLGLSELITGSREDFEGKAIELAKNTGKLLAIKNMLDRQRLTTPLFDTALFVRNIEQAYRAMHDRYQAGNSAAHIDVR